MERKTTLADGNIINIRNAERVELISKGYFENGELKKILELGMSDDFLFEAIIMEDKNIDNISSIDFPIPKYDPLYKHFYELLKGQDKLLIDDDFTVEDNKKYILIRQNEDIINIEFNNNLESDTAMFKFNISIKNIMRDGRSKIDRKKLDTKDRLIKFFRNINKEFLTKKETRLEEER